MTINNRLTQPPVAAVKRDRLQRMGMPRRVENVSMPPVKKDILIEANLNHSPKQLQLSDRKKLRNVSDPKAADLPIQGSRR